MSTALTLRVLSGTASQNDGLLRLYHGTDIDSARSIMNYGLDRTKASEGGGEGSFWLSLETSDAGYFATATMSDKPIILGVQIPVALATSCLAKSPPWLSLHPVGSTYYYKFQFSSFSTLNREMKIVSMIEAPLNFTEKR